VLPFLFYFSPPCAFFRLEGASRFRFGTSKKSPALRTYLMARNVKWKAAPTVDLNLKADEEKLQALCAKYHLEADFDRNAETNPWYAPVIPQGTDKPAYRKEPGSDLVSPRSEAFPDTASSGSGGEAEEGDSDGDESPAGALDLDLDLDSSRRADIASPAARARAPPRKRVKLSPNAHNGNGNGNGSASMYPALNGYPPLHASPADFDRAAGPRAVDAGSASLPMVFSPGAAAPNRPLSSLPRAAFLHPVDLAVFGDAVPASHPVASSPAVRASSASASGAPRLGAAYRTDAEPRPVNGMGMSLAAASRT
jgi:hypothetical protein